MATIVIIPGTGGSELLTGPSFFGYGRPLKVWLNYALIAAGAWRWLALSTDGRTSSFPGVGRLQPGWLLDPYYGLTVRFFGERGYTVIAPSLFWPGTISSDAASLASFLLGLSAFQPLHCLAHSRGGLVLRSALSILASSGNIGIIGRCAGLGVPHQGSWSSTALLAGWNKTEQQLGVLVSLGPGGSLYSPLYQQLLTAIRTWPAGYEMQPMPGASGSPIASTNNMYTASLWTQRGITLSPAWLSEAMAAWSALAPVPSAVSWIDVVGTGFMTVDQIAEPIPPLSPADCTYSTAGDGTVPARWATQSGRVSITTPTAHGSLPLDGRVLSALDGYYRNGLLSSITIPGPPLG